MTTPTKQQADFVRALVEGVSHLALVARAGTGKTHTILLGVAAYLAKFPGHEVLVCAFGKAIAEEIKGKLAKMGLDWRQAQAATTHSIGFGLVKFMFKPKVDDNKVRLLVRGRNEAVYREYEAQICQLVHLAKVAGVGFFTDSPIGDAMTWHALADHYDVNGLDDTSAMDAIVEAAQYIYRASLEQTDVVDFDDMVLFPLIKNIRVKFGKDLIFLDEAQDTNRTRQALMRKFLKRSGRMVVVGDDRQAIMGFAGAGADALTDLIKDLQAQAMPLTMTWRCPRAVVAEAQRLVPDIEAAEGAAKGEVAMLPALPEDLGAGDAVLCRNTAPLIQVAYSMIRQGKACKVEGRAIGEGLAKLAGRWKVKTIDALLNRLDIYREREMQKHLARGQDVKAEAVADKCETLVEICQAVLNKGQKDVCDVQAFINTMFADTDAAEGQRIITCATYHRSKGREWGRVYLYRSGLCPSPWAKQDWQKRQEENLAYVAITRAQQLLAYVN
jgi:superfamily I DNA/RNA helicase